MDAGGFGETDPGNLVPDQVLLVRKESWIPEVWGLCTGKNGGFTKVCKSGRRASWERVNEFTFR